MKLWLIVCLASVLALQSLRADDALAVEIAFPPLPGVSSGQDLPQDLSKSAKIPVLFRNVSKRPLRVVEIVLNSGYGQLSFRLDVEGKGSFPVAQMIPVAFAAARPTSYYLLQPGEAVVQTVDLTTAIGYGRKPPKPCVPASTSSFRPMKIKEGTGA